MATTVRLVPSVLYNAATTTYLNISDESNALTNTDSTNFATIENVNASTSARYIYLRGFNFSSIPNDAIVTDWTVKIKGYYTDGYSTSMYLCNNTTTQSNATASAFGNSTVTREFAKGSLTWDSIKAMGSDFGIRVNCRRNSRNTTAYYYIYGAEISVTYTIPIARTITSTLSGSGTINPSGANTYYDDDTYTLVITPTNSSDEVSATKNGTDITSSLVYHSGGTESAVLGAYTLISGGFNGSGASYFQGLVGKGHTSTQTTTNYYSSSQNSTAVFQYKINLSVPSFATITRLYMMANGHCENASQSSEYMCVQLKSGNTALSSQYNFKSAGKSNTTQTIEATTLPTVAQLEDLVVECTLGYYGGAINGVTVYCEFTADPYYIYSYTVDADATIAVTIGGGGSTQTIYYKNNGSWTAVGTVYKKVSGSWVQQTDLSNVFDSQTNYVKG